MTSPRVLVIEDDTDTAALIREVLADEAFDVTVASTGLMGLAAIRERPDIILCDIDLPDVSGLRVLQRIRADHLMPVSIPFIFVTAFAHREYQMNARRLGCDEYITKPIDFELLVAILRHRLAAGISAKVLEATEIRLTEREKEALVWAARGKASSEIAIILDISERTANFHIDNAMRKLGAATRIQAAVKASLLGLIRP